MIAIDGPVTTMSNATFARFAQWDAPTVRALRGAPFAEFTADKPCGRDFVGDRLGNYSAMNPWQREGCRRPERVQRPRTHL
jgi:hypothetical protein